MTIAAMTSRPAWTLEMQELTELSNKVQAWSLTRKMTRGDYGTFGQAGEDLKVTVDRIAEAVEWHYWMFTHDVGPVAERDIDHDGG